MREKSCTVHPQMKIIFPNSLQYDNCAELFEIPPLGRHYSHHWAMENPQKEQGDINEETSVKDSSGISVGGSVKNCIINVINCNTIQMMVGQEKLRPGRNTKPSHKWDL